MRKLRSIVLPIITLIVFIVVAPYSSASEKNITNNKSKYITFTETYWRSSPSTILLSGEGEEIIQEDLKGEYVTTK